MVSARGPERVPLDRDSRTLIETAGAQRDATEGVEHLLDRVTGEAEDPTAPWRRWSARAGSCGTCGCARTRSTGDRSGSAS